MANYKIGDYYDLKTNNKTILNKKELNGYEDKYFHEEDIKWQIFDIKENGDMLLISDKPTTQELTLSREVGFNNGIEAMDDFCKKLTGNEKARNLTHEDIINSRYWEEENKKDMIWGKDEELKYWLGSPYVTTYTNVVVFGVRVVSTGYVDYYNLYYSYGITGTYYYGVRPVLYVKKNELPF